jgi:hypothetical protein
MKYILTESQISKFVRRYLDSIECHINRDGDGDIFLGKEPKRSGIFWYRQGDGELLIDPDIYNTVRAMFGIGDAGARLEILYWFEDKFDRTVKIATVWWD